MIRSKSTLLIFALMATFLLGANPTHKLLRLKNVPDGFSKEIAALLDPAGYQVAGPKGAICEFWLLKELSVKAKFKPSLSVKYPFASGQLVGAMRIAKKTAFTDFRGQELDAGIYTLRYGVQPEDGNHIGTSELYDFLLALPAKVDKDPKSISLLDALHMQSAAAAGSTHPAIFSLLPAEKPGEKPTLTHEEDHDFWILSLTANAKVGNKKSPLAFRMVAIGKSEE